MSNYDPELISCFIEEASDGLDEWEAICIRLKNEKKPDDLSVLFRWAHNLKGGAGSVGLKSFSSVIHTLENLIKKMQENLELLNDENIKLLLKSEEILRNWLPSIGENPDKMTDAATILVNIVETQIETIQNTAKNQQENSGHESSPQVVSPTNTASNDLVNSANEVEPTVDNSPAKTEKTESPIAVVKENEVKTNSEPVAEKKTDTELKTQPSVSHKKTNETLRIGRDKIDHLMDLVGELNVFQRILTRKINKDFQVSLELREYLDQIDGVVSRLQEATIDLRLINLEPLFRRLERVCADVADTQNKQVNFHKEGMHVSLDKAVVEKIAEPLIHLVRNSIDHGLEEQNVRENLAKPRAGNIMVQAKEFGGSVEIKISDDGRGLNVEKIFQKGVERGLVSGVLSNYNKSDILNLIFSSGLSTASQVTDISGRGVGMDVVNSTVRSLGGQIQISSEEGKGAAFTVRIPTNLSLVEALVVRVDANNFAVPTQDVTEVIDLNDFSIRTTSSKQRLIELRGVPVIVEKISNQFSGIEKIDLSENLFRQKISGHPAVVVKGNSNIWALELDDIIEQQTMYVKPLSENIRRSRGLGGSTVLSNGDPCIVLNLSEFVHSLEVA